ncbi:MAG TPA: hypothetical protein VJ208_01405 [Candidatus Nanoarchaeia archaeon]|nr:hypothetical protein [Candidatus Nanoarchaeia archaeon]
MKGEIPNELFLEILEVLRLAPIAIFLGTDQEKTELTEDFKPWKWTGFKEESAEKSTRIHRELLNLWEEGKLIL